MQRIIMVIASFRIKFFAFVYRENSNFIIQKKIEQKKRYEELRSEFIKYYLKVKKIKEEKFIEPHWKEYNKILEKELLPFPPFAFLRNIVIGFTMFVMGHESKIKKELRFLEEMISKEKLKEFLQEDYVGNPIIQNTTYKTSLNAIHQLYSLIYYLTRTKNDVNRFKTVIELGGGYGCLAKIYLRYTSYKCTYVLIDTSLFSCLQWIYLTAILGREKTNMITSTKDKVKKDVINIIPIGLVNSLNLKGDLFISNWALSESSVFTQDLVFSRKWFSAKHVLVAYQKNSKNFPNAKRIEDEVKKSGFQIEAAKYFDGNYYAFK